MGGFDHLDAAGGDGMAVTRDHGASQLGIGPGVFQRGSHHRGRFSPADDNAAAARPGRQVCGQHHTRVSRGDGSIEQQSQRGARPRIVPGHA